MLVKVAAIFKTGITNWTNCDGTLMNSSLVLQFLWFRKCFEITITAFDFHYYRSEIFVISMNMKDKREDAILGLGYSCNILSKSF